jgi:hypothetical protein
MGTPGSKSFLIHERQTQVVVLSVSASVDVAGLAMPMSGSLRERRTFAPGAGSPDTEEVTATPNLPVKPRADLVERALPFLPAGPEIRQAFIAQAAPSFFFFIVTYLTGIMSRNKYRCVVVTDDGIYVLDSTKWSGGAKPREMVGRMPRHSRLGPVSGRWAEVDLRGERHWVHQRFHDQIAAADREGGF